MSLDKVPQEMLRDSITEVKNGLCNFISENPDDANILAMGMAAMMIGHGGLETVLLSLKTGSVLCHDYMEDVKDGPGMKAVSQYINAMEGKQMELDTSDVEKKQLDVLRVLQEASLRISKSHDVRGLSVIAAISYAAYYVGVSTVARILGIPSDDDPGLEAAYQYAEMLWGDESAEAE